MTWQENIDDFGEEIQPSGTFRFQCHPGLKCFGMCCGADIPLTPFDIACLRRHMATDSHRFLFSYCESLVDAVTGFPSVFLKKGDAGMCIFSGEDGCQVYDTRPSCCRYYPLAKAVEKDAAEDVKAARYYLQRRAHYCDGLEKGPEWTIEAYFDANGLGPYEKANDVFLDVPFAFETLPRVLRHDREVQTMIYQAVFDFDRFLKTYGPAGSSLIPEDDHEMIGFVTRIALNLIEKTAGLQPKE